MGRTVSSFGEGMSRVFNCLVAFVLLAFILPLILFVALAIKCDSPGPVFERHRSMALGSRAFFRLTFRTTIHDPQDRLAGWARGRTRVGPFLVYTRIVALPQLINVIRGDLTVLQRGPLAKSFLGLTGQSCECVSNRG
jgi:lipopolysaccharide/colanic/teichoic acid biosynthesis glycosyltransferase